MFGAGEGGNRIPAWKYKAASLPFVAQQFFVNLDIIKSGHARREKLYSFYSNNSLTELEFEHLQREKESSPEQQKPRDDATPIPTIPTPPQSPSPLSSSNDGVPPEDLLSYKDLSSLLAQEHDNSLKELYSLHFNNKNDTIESLLQAAKQDTSVRSALCKALGVKPVPSLSPHVLKSASRLFVETKRTISRME